MWSLLVSRRPGRPRGVFREDQPTTPSGDFESAIHGSSRTLDERSAGEMPPFLSQGDSKLNEARRYGLRNVGALATHSSLKPVDG